MAILSCFQRHSGVTTKNDRRSGKSRQRTKAGRWRGRRAFQPGIESLEDRSLPSSPNPVTSLFSGSGGQLGYDQTAGSVSTFLGDSFDKKSSSGKIVHNLLGSFGAEGHLEISGTAGIQYDASVNSGTVAAQFKETLNQNYVEPTTLKQVVNFAPGSGTGATYLSSGSNATGFSTTSPSVGASASLDLGLHTTLGAHFALFGTFGGETSFGGDLSIPLFSFNQNNDQQVKIFSLPVTSGISGIVTSNLASLDYPLTADPVPLRLHAAFDAHNLDFTQTVLLQAYPPPPELKPLPYYKWLGVAGLLQDLSFAGQNGLKNSVAAGVELGSLEEKVPQITLASSGVRPDGSLQASTSANVADLNLELGPLASVLMPALGPAALGLTTVRVNLTPGVHVDFTPISFQLSPALGIGQTASIVPVNTLTYQFEDADTGNPMSPDVFLNGVDQGPTGSISFHPGIDTLGVKFEGTAIKVVPTLEFQARMTNEFDLLGSLNATLTVGKLSGSAYGHSFQLGPIYQRVFNLGSMPLATLVKKTFNLIDTTQQLPSFTIGDTFKPSLIVNTTQDLNTSPASNGGLTSLRYAVWSANQLAKDHPSMPIQVPVPAGTYDLTIHPTVDEGTAGDDGTSGNLVVTAPNVTIVGAGAGQTIIDSSGLGLARAIAVRTGAGLTLKGVTIQGGTEVRTDLAGNDGLGGAVFEDTGASLEIDDSQITGNTAVSGGGIFAHGSLTINRSTISYNTAQEEGGGIYWDGTSNFTMDSSTVNNNDVDGAAGGDGTDGGGGGGGMWALGGGAFLGVQGIIRNSTFASNKAVGGAGGAGSFNNLTPIGGAGTQYVTGGFPVTAGGAGGGDEGFNGILVPGHAGLNGGGGGGAGHSGYFLVQSTSGGTGERGGDGGAGVTYYDANHVLAGAGGGGGGGDAWGGAILGDELTLVNDTIVGNAAVGGHGGAAGSAQGNRGGNGVGSGGGIYVVGGLIRNTILTNNSAGQGPDVEDSLTSDMPSLGHNVFSSSQGFNGLSASDQVLGPTIFLGNDYLLQPLGDYGGPTQTMRPRLPFANFPTVIGKGDPTNLSATDQRGFARTVNGMVDIGAVEYQYDLVLQGNEALANGSPGVVTYSFQVTNNGPDPAYNVTLTDPLPTGVTFQSQTHDSDWSETDPSAANNNTVTFTDAGRLDPGQSANFTITVQLNSFSNTPVSNTATLGPTTADNNLANNVVTLTVFDEGQAFSNAVLYHFAVADPTVTASDLSANVTWGDSQSNSSDDGTGTVSIVANPNGGFDVLGSHAYADQGTYTLGVTLTSALPGFGSLTPGFPVQVAVADVPLAAVLNTQLGDVRPDSLALVTPPVVHGDTYQNAILATFPNPQNLDPSAYIAIVDWGDGSVNSTDQGTAGAVTLVANPLGGLDVVGSHTYSTLVVGAIYSVVLYDVSSRSYIPISPVLFHFADSNPSATSADFTATIRWGDGSSESTFTSSNGIYILADPNGGFDVLGSHIYTTAFRQGTFTVQVTDNGGASVSASNSRFGVDAPLTAGTLTPPSVTTEGQSVQNAVLFHFTDTDPQGQASDFTATVSWGDSTGRSSEDGTAAVAVVANPSGGFDVVGSHTFEETANGATFAVQVTDIDGAITGAEGPMSLVADPAVVPTWGFTVQAVEWAPTGMQSVFSAQDQSLQNVVLYHFSSTDPAATPADYVAVVAWRDGQIDSSGDGSVSLVADPAGGFDVVGSHVYAQAGTHPVGVAVLNRLATFADPGGAEDVGDYTASIDWGDGTSSTGFITWIGDVGSPTAVFTVAGSHQYQQGGSYVISVTLSHDAAPTATTTSTAAVADPALVGTGGYTISAVAGIVSDPQTVATFRDPGGAAALSHYTATIDWGDGTTSPGLIQVSPSPAPLGLAGNFVAGTGVTGLVTGDLNGDGKTDLVVANAADKSVSVFLSNGDGSFQQPQTLRVGTAPLGLSLADLNGDGKLDLITADPAGTVSVLLGNGDGTFGPETDYPVATGAFALAVADLRHNGTRDLLALSPEGASVLLGNGDGTFGPAQTVSFSGSDLSALAVGDVDGDGYPDLVVTDLADSTVKVLRGNGDGSFGTATSYAVDPLPASVVLAHLHGAGNLDLAVASTANGTVSVLPGNGDGTFGTANDYAVGTEPTTLLAADINGDGNVDLVTANAGTNDVSVLPGNGDGAFGAATSLGVGAPPSALAAVALTGDRLDLVTADASSGTVSVLLPAYAVVGSHSYPGRGTYPVTVTLNHDGVTSTAPSSTAQVTQASTTTVVTSSAATNTSAYGQDVTFTATVTPAGSGTPTGTVQFYLNGNPFGSAVSLSAGQVTIDAGTALTPAGYQITASYGGSSSFLPSSSTALTYTVTPAPLTVTADNLGMVYGSPVPTLTGTLTGVVNGDNITASYSTSATSTSDVGAYAITATLNDPSGRLSYYSVTNNSGTLTIGKADQTITWDNPADIVYGTALGTAQLGATVSVVGPAPAGALTYSPAAGTVLSAGSGQVLSVTAAATTDYNAATKTVTINVAKASPTISTAASPTSGLVGAVTLNDAATLSGGYNETGSISFALYAPGVTASTYATATPVFKATVTVNGNGTYSPATGYVPTAAGTYNWVDSYSGDANTNAIASTFGSDPATATTFSISGSAYDDLTENGFSTDDPKLGTADANYASVTINLYKDGGATPFATTSTDANGKYGFTGLPAGSYTASEVVPGGWKETGNRGAASGGPSGTASVTATSGGSSTGNDFDSFKYGQISGSLFHDLTGDGFSADDPALTSVLQAVTLKLFKNGGATPFASTTQDRSGLYGFTGLDYGSYSVQEVVPANWVQTAGRGAAVTGTVTAASGLNSGGNDFDDAHVGAKGNPQSKGYWTNSGNSTITASDITTLNTLNLRDGKGNLVSFSTTSITTARAQVANFLSGASSAYPANMLSAQLAALELNVLHGFVSTGSVIYDPNLAAYSSALNSAAVGGAGALYNGGFITVGNMINAVKNELGLYGNPSKTQTQNGILVCNFENELQVALNGANLNQNFVI
jgi:uncharacterized repeat protein (TIGR01451 family)